MLRSVESPIENELEAHRRALTGYCYRMIGSGAEAEDAVQETMVRAWKSADKLQERAALKAWLFRIANNVCLDMLGSAQRRATPMDMGPSSTHDTPLGAQLADSAYVRPIADAKVLDATADPADLAAERGDAAARVRGRAPAPAGQAARGADPARGAALAGQRGRGAARHERRRRSTARCSAPARRSRSSTST